MKRSTLFFLLAILFGAITTMSAQDAVALGTQVTSEDDLVSGNEYILQSQASGKPYIADAGTYYSLPNAGNTPTSACVYVLTKLSNGAWSIKGKESGKYWGIPVYNQALAPAEGPDAGAWTLNFSGGVAYPTAPDAEGEIRGLDRSAQRLWGYTTGTGITKQVKFYTIGEAPLSEQPLSELDGLVVSVADEPAADLATGQWYVMFDRGVTGSNPHGFLYEKVSSHTLYNTATKPAGPTTSAARFLVRLTDATDGNYYIQTGFGNYFGAFMASTPVSVTATPEEPIAITKIAGTDGHFCLQAVSTGVILDANSLEQGDATVVGWGTTVPTTTGGNNDWAFYPVSITPDESIISSLEQLQTGWYTLEITEPSTHSGLYAYNADDEHAYNADAYPLAYQATAATPDADDARYYIRFERSGNDVIIQSANGHYLDTYAKASTTPVQLAVAYDNGFRFASYFHPFSNSSGRIIGKASNAASTRFNLRRANPDEGGLTAWNVHIEGGLASAQLTCTLASVSGLQSVFDGGYFFLPADVTPQASDFTMDGIRDCVIDDATKTITASYDPEMALLPEGVSVTQGYQTTGRGNANALLLRIDLTPVKAMNGATLNIALDETTVANISSLYLYETAATEFMANIPAAPLATTSDITASTAISIGDVAEGLHHYWLCASVKEDAELGAIIDAAVASITYTADGASAEKTLTTTTTGNPQRRGMRIFDRQSFVCVPTTDDCRFYRIPAMITDQEGNIVVAYDRRYSSNADLGNHKIDVAVKRSTDGGLTWSKHNIVAVGNTSSEKRYGFGDASLVRTKSGRLICLMAAGQNGFFGTNHSGETRYMTWVGMVTSDDNGQTWQGSGIRQPKLITESAFGKTGASIFVSSGKGLTTADGTVMFTTNVREANGAVNCYILKTNDDGQTWTLVPEVAYNGADESKVEQLNDGSLLLSVRQSGNRGWNHGKADGTGWGSQYRTGDIWGNACNSDIIYYSRATEGQPDILLHTYINTAGRESLQLTMSIDQGQTWHDVLNIQPNGSCYSTMQVLADGSLAILFEDESYSAGNGYAITYVTLTREQILEMFTAIGGVMPDGINAPSDEDIVNSKSVNSEWYDLSGRRVNNPARGLYITDGQKVMIP